MLNTELFLTLMRRGIAGDRVGFRRTLEAVIADARAQQKHGFADALAACLQANGTVQVPAPDEDERAAHNLYVDIAARKRFADLILSPTTRQTCEELMEEQRNAEHLRASDLHPRHRVLLHGLPGTGKTTLAEAFATELGVPFCKVLYHRTIGETLRDTVSRLWRIFDSVRTRPCVLFFDEFETIAKERGDRTDESELKRAVSTLLLQIDDLPSHVVLVAATNHLELMDSAAWRRFQIRIDLPKPTFEQVCAWFERLTPELVFPPNYQPAALAELLRTPSWGELEEFTTDIRRRCVLAGFGVDIAHIIEDRVHQYNTRFVSAY